MLFGGKGLDKIELWQTRQKSEDFLGFQKWQNHRNGEVTFDTSFYISQRIRASEKLVSSKIRSFTFMFKEFQASFVSLCHGSQLMTRINSNFTACKQGHWSKTGATSQITLSHVVAYDLILYFELLEPGLNDWCLLPPRNGVHILFTFF